MKEFAKWDSAAAALAELDALLDGKVPPILVGLMESLKDEKKLSLAVADKTLGTSLQKLPGLNITPVAAAPGSVAGELYRGIREHMADLIPGIQPEGFKTMSLGLSHSLSRHKLKFSADKVDVMIVQAISLLDDLDKELNVYAMRVKEWYGWHFPELGKILNDNLAYAKVVLTVGMRENLANTDLADLLPEEIEAAVKAAADVSMGTEITEEDLENIKLLAEQVVSYTEYRAQLSAYLESRMRAIAPNLTELLGYLVGARLIAHTGSLMNLAKSAGSTVQILGAEKALFRALKTKHSTPKYGLIYHSSLVGQATGKNKGKIARQLAAKAALGVRADALSDWNKDEVDEDDRGAMGAAARARLENNLRRLEGKALAPKGAAVKPALAPGKWDVKEARKYNIDVDGLSGNEPAAADTTMTDAPAESSNKKEKKKSKEKKKEKKSKAEANGFQSMDVDEDAEDTPNGAAGMLLPSCPCPASPTTSTTDLNPARAMSASVPDARHRAQTQRRPDRTGRRRNKTELPEQRTNRVLDLLGPSRVTPSPSPVPKTLAGPSSSTGKLSDADYERLAKAAGISVVKFRRKFDRGDVDLDEEGNPIVHSKKEVKKMRKAEARGEQSKPNPGEKRKREDDGEKPKKKKKRQEAES